MIVKNIFKWIKNPKHAVRFMLRLRISRLIPDEKFLKLKYKYLIGKNLNLNNPRSFNEKLQWLKLHDRKPEYTKFADKYEVREHIRKTIGAEYLIPLKGVYDSVDEINWDDLPKSFVLKCTHGSSSNIICVDKEALNVDKAKKSLKKWMKKNWYWFGREWQYKNIKPRILCESFIVDESGIELKDYKFMCFGGKVKCTFVCMNRNTKNGQVLNIDIYDTDWKLMPFKRYAPNSGRLTPRPRDYDKMVYLAEILAADTAFIRVDFYETNEQLYFGELTLHPQSGFGKFSPESYDYLLGSWINLPNKAND
ncbi:MAG: ATP-grasp fold amidoligase family protein [Acetobacterium sp.]|uniref:ATP-grasp fold amidoligase family protein n=1 Tax=Acetobacterium sp. TaxID=1872094 RepID=UPI0032420363